MCKNTSCLREVPTPRNVSRSRSDLLVRTRTSEEPDTTRESCVIIYFSAGAVQSDESEIRPRFMVYLLESALRKYEYRYVLDVRFHFECKTSSVPSTVTLSLSASRPSHSGTQTRVCLATERRVDAKNLVGSPSDVIACSHALFALGHLPSRGGAARPPTRGYFLSWFMAMRRAVAG